MLIVKTPIEVSTVNPSPEYMLSVVKSYLGSAELLVNLTDDSVTAGIKPELKRVALIYLPWAVKVLENMSGVLDQPTRQRVGQVMNQAKFLLGESGGG